MVRRIGWHAPSLALWLLLILVATFAYADTRDWPPYKASLLDANGTTTTLDATLTVATQAQQRDWAYPYGVAVITTITADVTRFSLDADRRQPPYAGQKWPYVIPADVFAPPTPQAGASTAASNIVASLDSATAAFTLTDRVSNQVLFTMSNLKFGPNMLEFTSQIVVDKDTYLSGYGEHDYFYFLNHDLLSNSTNNVTLSLWNTDNGTPWKLPMYGIHPVIFVARPQAGHFSAIVFVNSHAQQMEISTGGLRFYAIGGTLEAYVIRGTSMMDVVRKYHTIIIKPTYVPPYWAFGTHQCRWGYRNLTELKSVVANYQASNIPLEVIWSDIDYMDQYRVFTTDPVTYPTNLLAAWLQRDIHGTGRRYVQIVDPGVAQAENYTVYSSGIANKAYVTDAHTGLPIVNVVWPGWTVFPDFTSTSVGQWWQSQIATYRAAVAVDGLWLDMNELGTFCNGGCPVNISEPWTFPWLNANWTKLTTDICLGQGKCYMNTSVLNFPESPTPLTNGYNLAQKTLDMTALTAMGEYYDTKAFFAFMEEKHTHAAMQQLLPDTRPFLLSRATFVGSGQYTSHWTGDNSCSWAPKSGGIADSVQGCLAANLWGVNHVGADIGGFSGTPQEELVVRWSQLGSFYTFTRNHHGLDDSPGQEPYRWSANAQATIRAAYNWRYKLLPYIFSTVAEAHYRGGPSMRHLSLSFPADFGAYQETTSFMLGDSILVAPVVVEGATSVETYVPTGAWYRLRPAGADPAVITGPSTQTLTSALYNDDMPVLVLAGSILPVHTATALTVTATRQSGLSLWCLLNPAGAASGFVYMDTQGSRPMPPVDGQAYRLDYSAVADANGGTLTAVKANASVLPDGIDAGVGYVRVQFAAAPAQPPATFAVDNVLLPGSACSWTTSSAFQCALPTTDASRPFTLTWGTHAASAVSAPPKDDGKVKITKAGLAFTAIGCFVAGVAAVGVVMFVRRRRSKTNEAINYSRVR